MDPPGGVPPGEEPPQLVMRPVSCLVRSRAAGQQQYTILESKATKRMANLAWTGHQAFSKLAPDLVKSGVDLLELEEVGFVQHGSVTNMLQQGFQDALFVTDESFSPKEGGAALPHAPTGPAAPPAVAATAAAAAAAQQHQQQQGQGQGAGGGGRPQYQQQQQQQHRQQ